MQGLVLLHQGTAEGQVVACVNPDGTLTSSALDLDWEDYVVYDKRYERPAEVELLIGNPAKAKKQLGWEPKVKFKELVDIMVAADLALAKNEKAYANATASV